MRPGPAPKPTAARRRWHQPTGLNVTLPADGYSGPIPDWPATLNEATDREATRWAELWRTPQAAAWVGRAQEHTVATVVRLEQACDKPRIPAQLVAELRHLRGELGLTMEGMLKLGLVLEEQDPAPVTPIGRGQRRIRAADPDIA